MCACVLNGTTMGVYEIANGFFTSTTGWDRKDLRTTFCSAMCSALAMTVTGSPFDRIRTALMNQGDNKQYEGFAHCAAKLAKQDGIASFWRGFVPTSAWPYTARRPTGLLFLPLVRGSPLGTLVLYN